MLKWILAWQNLKSVVGIKSQPVYLIGSQNQSFCAFCFHALVRKMGFFFERLEDSYNNLTLTLICPMTCSSLEIVLVKACSHSCTTTVLYNRSADDLLGRLPVTSSSFQI